jgi:prepilin-type N-terminal cleavage/methylation domain-containing protein
MRKQTECGFSLIEVVISMALLTVGMVSLLGVFGLAMASTQTSQQDMIAKQLANEALESIMTARNTSQLGWGQVQNITGSCPAAAGTGIFMSGAQPINKSGADGIFGTCDDAAAGAQSLEVPGADGVYGSTDDVIIPLSGYQRTILISPVTDSNGVVIAPLRAINISITYTTAQNRAPKTYTLSSFISQYQ